MLVTNIIKRINKTLAGEQLTYSQLEPFLDEVIDDINTQLNSTYPVFSDLEFGPELEYNYFPEKFIRSVVIKGAAYKFYLMDEEGMQTADAFNYDYQLALFNMVRDYIDQVPEEYAALYTGGIKIEEDFETYFNHGVW